LFAFLRTYCRSILNGPEVRYLKDFDPFWNRPFLEPTNGPMNGSLALNRV